MFLHGGGQAGWVWDETIDALRRQTDGAFGRALALDAPGCGAKRARAAEDIDSAGIAEELIADIEAAGFSGVVLVGHSHAGSIIPLMLERRPSLFKRAIYVSCLVPTPGVKAMEMFGSELRGREPGKIGWPIDFRTPDRRAFYKAMFGNDMGDAEFDAFHAKLGRDQWAAGIHGDSDWRYDHCGVVPASYVILLQDQALPQQWQEIFARRVKAERTPRIDAGHQAMNTRPHALAEVLLIEAIQAGGE